MPDEYPKGGSLRLLGVIILAVWALGTLTMLATCALKGEAAAGYAEAASHWGRVIVREL